MFSLKTLQNISYLHCEPGTLNPTMTFIKSIPPASLRFLAASFFAGKNRETFFRQFDILKKSIVTEEDEFDHCTYGIHISTKRLCEHRHGTLTASYAEKVFGLVTHSKERLRWRLILKSSHGWILKHFLSTSKDNLQIF